MSVVMIECTGVADAAIYAPLIVVATSYESCILGELLTPEQIFTPNGAVQLVVQGS